jgi:leader peptidase (prepilin peptidase)/N-methyltransferase
MAAADLIIAAAFGALFGSFLNVCIYRIPKGRSIVWPGSACGSCGHLLAWFENIPVVSYVVLGGRCRACRSPISLRYPFVELVTAAMFAGAFWMYGPSLLLASRLLFGCALIVLFAIDLEHHLLPNVITIPGVIVGFAFSFMTPPGWFASLIGIIVGGGVLWVVAEGYYLLRHEEGLGMGDVKMLAMIGAFVGILFIVSRRGGLKYALPFGTFLALGAALAATIGPGVLDWYLGFYQ